MSFIDIMWEKMIIITAATKKVCTNNLYKMLAVSLKLKPLVP